ncbi:hypothetical protein [Diaminobutyricimonas sp. LJ205]|uniref:hypothetical protein n=1 Tax=Diaminobutyricimonas sp. LJ205 TaxID=2683590 RepID=UPI0012F4CE32|nr:hypothetical protein [Diaminobutyricimonas sp. LJ205]
MTAIPVMKKVLVYGGVLALAIAVVGSIVGWFVAGVPGLVSALIGTAMAAVFLGITAGSIMIATKVTKSEVFSPLFFGIVMGAWLLKFVVFLVLVFVLKDQPFIDPLVLFLTIVVGVVGSLVVDLIAVTRSRVPYVSDVSLPGDDQTGK